MAAVRDPDPRRGHPPTVPGWGTHFVPRLGGYEVRAITPRLVDLRDQLARAKVPPPTVRKTLMLLQRILRRAVVQGLTVMNPVQAVPKPKQPPDPGPAAALAGDG